MVWPPAIGMPAAAAHRGTAFENAADGLSRQHIDRHAHQGQRQDRPPAHRVDIADRVGGGDAAEVERVVDDRHEEVGGGDQRLLVVELVHRGVVGGFDADQQFLGHRHRRRALEDFRQHARRDLAAAAAAVRQRGQSRFGGSFRCVHHGPRARVQSGRCNEALDQRVQRSTFMRRIGQRSARSNLVLQLGKHSRLSRRAPPACGSR